MMSNNKILTVSYGTFSCTLEGFDDSFGTMKAIAEYFRDLAADDRYFGAEPPQPDAEMLTRIAEREISRRVQAREHEGKIVLSASQDEAPTAPAIAKPVQDDAPVADDSAAEDSMIAAVARATEVDASETDHSDSADASASEDADANVTDVLQPAAEDEPQLEDDVDQPEEAASQDAADAELVEDEGDASEAPEEISDATEHAEAFFASPEDTTDEAEEDLEFETLTDEDEAVQDDEIVSANEEETAEATEVIAPPAPAAPDSIAAKLQRIRAVVSQSQQEDEAEELFEDEHAEDVDVAEGMAGVMDLADDGSDADDDASETIANAARAIEEAQAIDDATQEGASAVEDEDEDDIGAILARYDTSAKIDADDEESDAFEVDSSDDDIIRAVSDQNADAQDDLGPDTLAALMAADDGQVDAEDAGQNIFDETDASEDDEVTQAPRRARIIKVKRADIDAALASGHLEEVDYDDEDEMDDADISGSTLSEQEEAELMAELAEVEAEQPEDAMDGDQAEQPAARADDKKAAALKDDDVSRLMAEADNQMDEPEGNKRRSAFAHLKAAVMAKKADAGIGEDTIKSDMPFRSDLASVVKPRRPEAGGARAERPEGQRPAPLKLVAEQRVDVDAAPKGPVRPRRVAAVEDSAHEAGSDGSFADYAADMGAHDLPDLLEAAASYLSFVEGRDQFSRPQLMNKVRQVEKDEFSREDGLRSFGQLLRAGKIEKMKGGRFAVTDDIGYRPDHRAAG